MLGRRVSAIDEELEPNAALDHVARLAACHRVQASPGFRAASAYIESAMRKCGLGVETLSFPAQKGVRWWSQESFDEWACDDAEFVLLEDGKRQRLCSYAETKISVIQRSAPTPPGGLRTALVQVENATEPRSYSGLDVRGKIVFSRGDATKIAKMAVDRYGAAGILVDNIRELPPVRDRLAIPDARQYVGFWPADAAAHRAFGFVVSPRQGDLLRRMFSATRTELQVWANVVSRFYPGSFEVVTATIPGEGDASGEGGEGDEGGEGNEEVVALAHLCHPEPSANDNASGAGTLMEVARALSRLIADGRLPRPRRTIRFLWLPEMTGSYAYLANNEARLGKVVAAINLDMVGQNQELCGSSFTVEKPPRALPGFGGDLAQAVLGFLTREASNYAATASYPLFRWAVTPFSGGSDHNIWGDPSVGVTCPQLIQWPDRYYHTSEDTVDKVDPRMLRLAGAVTAGYLHTAALGAAEDAAFLAGEMASGFAAELNQALQDTLRRAREKIESAPTPEARLEETARARRAIERQADFLADRKRLDVLSLLRMAPEAKALAVPESPAVRHIAATAEFLKGKALGELAAVAGLGEASSLPPVPDLASDPAELKAKTMVPVRVHRGPFSTIARGVPEQLEERAESFNARYKGQGPPLVLVQYWADGSRTLSEIADCIEGETGFRQTALLLEYVELMVQYGAFQVRELTASR